MQKILSSIIFKQYQTYTPQQIEMFKRAASINKPSNKQILQPTAATQYTKQHAENQQANNYIQVTQFQEVKDRQQEQQLKDLGKIIQQIQNRVQEIIIRQNSFGIAKNNTKIIQKQQPKKQITLPTQSDQHYKQKPFQKPNNRKISYLKFFKQKIQEKKQETNSSKNRRFNLQQFKTRLNYLMYKSINNF